MSDKIKIKHVHGGSSADHEDLKGCYFLETSTAGEYEFYDQNNDLVSTTPSIIESGTDFTFSLDDPMETWSITDLVISGTGNDATATGNWSNNAEITNDDGSFQADAKGTLPEEASSASA
jgi:hypothetical protein